MLKAEVAIIGGGPAGMAAALEAYRNGISDIIIFEREVSPGGILQQCIHNGFGLHIFQEELTGPEYADRFIRELAEHKNIKIINDTSVLEITPNLIIKAVNDKMGVFTVEAASIILAMGCRERSFGSLKIPGTRPAGIYTAGLAQRFINIEGYLPGKKAVILGSGDIGLIMARRLTLEGAKVEMVCEIMPYPGGLERNIVQCLEDYDIPLRLSCTVVKIHGIGRLEGITVAKVDDSRRIIPGTEEYVECDTLLLSVGLIPENELSEYAGIKLDHITSGPVVDEFMHTSVSGIFACGNAVHVHDLVDYVTSEGFKAGKSAAKYVRHGGYKNLEKINITAGKGVRYIVPQIIYRYNEIDKTDIFFRADRIYHDAKISIKTGETILYTYQKSRVVPGEMQRIEIDKGILKNIYENEIEFNIS